MVVVNMIALQDQKPTDVEDKEKMSRCPRTMKSRDGSIGRDASLSLVCSILHWLRMWCPGGSSEGEAYLEIAKRSINGLLRGQITGSTAVLISYSNNRRSPRSIQTKLYTSSYNFAEKKGCL